MSSGLPHSELARALRGPVASVTVSAAYLEWAHGPAAEDGYAPAVEVLKATEGRRHTARVRVPLTPDAARELRAVASLWASNAGAGEDVPSGYVRTARRILAEVPAPNPADCTPDADLAAAELARVAESVAHTPPPQAPAQAPAYDVRPEGAPCPVDVCPQGEDAAAFLRRRRLEKLAAFRSREGVHPDAVATFTVQRNAGGAAVLVGTVTADGPGPEAEAAALARVLAILRPNVAERPERLQVNGCRRVGRDFTGETFGLDVAEFLAAFAPRGL